MKQFTDHFEIPVVEGSAHILINGMETHIMQTDSITITYRVKMRWWLRWLIRDITIERVSSLDGTRELSSLRNASVE